LKNARDNELSDRRTAAAEAKTALLNAYRTAKTAIEPARLARQAERMAIAAARDERRLERERVKIEERERLPAETAERQTAARTDPEARETAETNRIARGIEDEAARKAERDRRYTNRKTRQA
jgi:hypothetical protein